MVQDLALRIVLVVAGLAALAFGIANGFSHGWQLDINLMTIFAAIALIIVGIFVKNIRQRK
ncbi:MAG: hypothetical protein ACXW1F_05820 [Halobacteriota archaeon]